MRNKSAIQEPSSISPCDDIRKEILMKGKSGVKHTPRHTTVIGLHTKLNTNWHKTLTALTYWQVPLPLKGTEVFAAFQLTLKFDLAAIIIRQRHLLMFDAVISDMLLHFMFCIISITVLHHEDRTALKKYECYRLAWILWIDSFIHVLGY